ncbi:MAG: hypothetical protein C4589_11275 [Peptococcaceae bacterium]|jgi:hypothetical protein|nr:MAG: hypothetical protein C4589_11275 [Peptococcaceae bacterium]
MTVSELEDILKHLTEIREAEEYQEWHRFAFLASVVVNVNRGKKGKRFKPEDFIGKPPWEKQKKKRPALSAEERRRELDELKRMLGEI